MTRGIGDWELISECNGITAYHNTETGEVDVVDSILEYMGD